MEKKNWKLRSGVFLMVLSVVLFLSLPVIPFLDMDSKTKVSVSTVIFILAEITFWGGGLLVGKELFSKYKSYLNPKNWFGKKKEGNKEENSLPTIE